MIIQKALQQLIERRDLTQADMHAAMMAVMTGEATPAQIGAFLVALRMKGETVTEITAAAQVMREFSTKVNVIVGENGTGKTHC